MILLAGCVQDAAGTVVRAPGETAEAHETAEVDETGDAGETGDVGETGEDAPCPEGMVRVGVCIDRWEATIEGWSPYEVPDGGIAVSEAGRVPQGYISGDVASAVCEAAGKRLCTVEEWMAACGERFPYGDVYDPLACNTEYAGSHPVCDYFGTCDGVWDTEHMNDPGINQQPGTVAETGAYAGCVTPDGVFDLHGNLHEWVADEGGTFKGGFYADASINGEGCAYTTTAHATGYHDYSTGFRCCADPRG